MAMGAGGFAAYTPVAHADVNLVTLPDDVSFVDGAALGCRFMTAFHGVTQKGRVKAADWVAVFGCGGGVHVSVECLGTAATWMPCIMSLRKRGRVVRLGMTGAEERGILPIPADMMVGMEIEIVGSYGMQARCYPEMLNMISAGVISPSTLVVEQVPMEGASGVLERMSDFDTIGYSVIVND